MTWFKVDDTFAIHPKVVQAGNDAIGLWTRAGAWSSQQLTGGKVPAYMVPVLGGSESQVRSLVRVGLWEESEDGYQFHGWEEWQPDSEAERARRQSVSETKRAAGKVGNHERWHVKRGVVDPECEHCASHMRSQNVAPANPKRSPRPDPSRPTTPYGSSTSSTRARDEPPEPNPEPEMSVNAILAAAGLARHEIRDFLVDLKDSGAKSTARVVNSLHRDGKLGRRIAEWRDERNLAAEAASRPSAGRRTTDDRVADGFAIAAEFRALEQQSEDPNVIPFRQIEGA